METTTRRDATRCGKFTMGRGKGGALDARRGQVSANGIVTGLAGPAWEVWLCLDTHKDSDRLLHGSHGWEAPRSQTTQHTSRCLWQTTYLGRERIAENGNMVRVPPVSPRPAPDLRYTSPASDKQVPSRHRLKRVRCHAAGMGGRTLDGDRRHSPFWEAATRSSVGRDQ